MQPTGSSQRPRPASLPRAAVRPTCTSTRTPSQRAKRPDLSLVPGWSAGQSSCRMASQRSGGESGGAGVRCGGRRSRTLVSCARAELPTAGVAPCSPAAVAEAQRAGVRLPSLKVANTGWVARLPAPGRSCLAPQHRRENSWRARRSPAWDAPAQLHRDMRLKVARGASAGVAAGRSRRRGCRARSRGGRGCCGSTWALSRHRPTMPDAVPRRRQCVRAAPGTGARVCPRTRSTRRPPRTPRPRWARTRSCASSCGLCHASSRRFNRTRPAKLLQSATRGGRNSSVDSKSWRSSSGSSGSSSGGGGGCGGGSRRRRQRERDRGRQRGREVRYGGREGGQLSSMSCGAPDCQASDAAKR